MEKIRLRTTERGSDRSNINKPNDMLTSREPNNIQGTKRARANTHAQDTGPKASAKRACNKLHYTISEDYGDDSKIEKSRLSALARREDKGEGKGKGLFRCLLGIARDDVGK